MFGEEKLNQSLEVANQVLLLSLLGKKFLKLIFNLFFEINLQLSYMIVFIGCLWSLTFCSSCAWHK